MREISHDIAQAVHSLQDLPSNLSAKIAGSAPDTDAIIAEVDGKVDELLADLPDIGHLADSVAEAAGLASGPIVADIDQKLDALADISANSETVGNATSGLHTTVVDAIELPATLLGSESEPVTKGILAELFYDDGAESIGTPDLPSSGDAQQQHYGDPLDGVGIESIGPADEALAEVASLTTELAGLSYLESAGNSYEGMLSTKDGLGLL